MVILLVLATFFVGINADCIPTPIQHTETGDEFYRVLLKDLADVEFQGATLAKQIQGTGCMPTMQSLDFFTQLVITIITDYYWLENLLNGTISPTGSECVAVNMRIDFNVRSTAGKASTPIPGASCAQLTGKALSQYMLQKGGLAVNAVFAAGAAISGSSGSGSSMPGSYYAPTTGSTINPGKWQKYVQDLVSGIANVRTIITNNDEANCLAATRKLASVFAGVLEAGDYTTLVV